MKYTYRKADFQSLCTHCGRENMQVYFSETDINSDAAICLDCLEEMQSNISDEDEIEIL